MKSWGYKLGMLWRTLYLLLAWSRLVLLFGGHFLPFEDPGLLQARAPLPAAALENFSLLFGLLSKIQVAVYWFFSLSYFFTSSWSSCIKYVYFSPFRDLFISYGWEVVEFGRKTLHLPGLWFFIIPSPRPYYWQPRPLLFAQHLLLPRIVFL